MNDINLQTKNVVQLFIINPREFSKLSSLDFDFLKDLLIKINTEKDNAVNDKINTITISLELIKAIVINNFPCNVEGLFKFLIGKSLDLIHFKSSRYTVTSLLLKIIEEEFSSNEKYVDNNKNIIKKMNIFLDEENQFDVKDLIKSLRESVLNKELILCIEPHSNIDNKIITNNISISSNMIQEGLLNFQNRAYNSILKMSKSDNSRPYSKLSNGLFIKMITKLYKDSDGGKIISNCLENDFKLSLAIAECTTNNYLMEIIETIKTDDDTKHNFERIDSCLAEIPDILSMIQLIKYCSFDINNLENIMSILGSVIAASYKSLLNNLAKSKHQDTNDELAGNSPLEFLNKLIIETSATFDYLHMHKPLLVFGALNILGFHKFINEATRTCKLEFENLVHNNQDFLFLSRAVLQKLNNLIIFSNKESELNWQGDNDIDITSNLTVLLKSSSRNWLCLILNDKNLQIMLFWLEILHHNAAQTITNLLEQNTLSSPPHVSTTDNILYVDDEDGPGEEYGLNHLFTDYQEKVKPSISNTSSIIRYESRNDNQKLSAQFVNEILKSMSLVVMNDDPVIHKLILQQFDEKALQSVFTLATLIDQEIINMKDSQAPSDLNELTKLFVNFINLLFSSNVINQARSVYFLSLISVQLPKDCHIKECEMPMNLELGPMTILIIMNISIHFTNPGAFQDNSIGWLKSDIYIKLMWKNIFHSIKQSTINNNYKCVDIRQELIQLYLLIFHGLTSISGKTEIVFDLLNCITDCSGFKTGVQPRLISRLLIILTYLVHHFYEQSSSLAFQIQYNLLTKYISDSINSDASNYQYDEVQIFDQKTNVIFYDISIPWIASKKFWPGLNPDSLILKNMVNHPQYESFFNGVLDGIQMCLDHRQVYDESQKFSLLSFTGSFYNILLSWRLMEVLPLPDKYQQDIPNIELSCYTRLICSFLKLRNDAKANLLSGKNNLTEELLLIDCQSETKYDLDQHIIHLIANLCERICLDIKNEPAHLPQQIYQIDMIIVSLNFILQCIKDDIDHPSTAEKPSVNTKCYLNSETSENSALSKNLIPIILNIYETLIRQIQLFISRHNCQTGLASLDLLSLTKMSSMELKFDYVNLDLLKSLNVELEKAIDKANWKDIGKESNEITFSHIKQFLASKSFDTKFCIEHDNIIDMIRAESYRRFVFIADHCKFDSSPIGDSVKLILSTTMLAIEDLRETLNLLDNFQMEIPNIPIDSFGKYVDLIVINNINTFVPTTNLPAKSLKSIPNSIYSQVIARKLFSIFFDFHGNTSEANNAGYYDIMNQTIECLINMLDKTIDLSCLSEIVSVFLENASNESHSNIYLIFTLIFNVDRSVPIALKCSLLKLINLIFYRYKNCGKDKQLQDILKKLNYGIHHVTNEQSNTDMIAKIKNWVQELLMNVEVPDENCKSDYLANVLLFSELLALTSYDDEDDRNLCIVICKSILQMDENVRSWLIENRNAFSTSDYSENCQLINLHIIIEMMCVISNGNCSLSVYVNVIQTLLDWNKEINKSLSKYTEHKQSYGPKMELICASLTKIYNHIGAVICALNTNYQSESMKSNLNDILYNMKPSSELYLNDFNMNQLSIDKRAIEEILFCQVKHNPNFGENDLINSESEEEKIMKLNPLDDQLCTFAATQKEFTDQHWYHCHTCSMVENEGVCTICAKVCHLGHDLTYAKRGSFFCDCGAKGSNFCEALTRRTNRTTISKKSQLHASQSTSIDAIKKDKPSMKSQFFEKSKYNFQTRFSKFSSNEKLLRKSYKADTKSRLTAHKMTAAADSGSCPEVTNDDESTSTNMISNAISTVFSVNQSKQVAYRNWITAVLRERILKENETLTILLETSTLLDDCFTALQIIHESFKVQYSDWTVGKNKQMKEAFKSVRTSEKISERVTTIMFTAPSLIGITISDIITKSRQPFNPINSSFNKLSSPTKPKPIVATSRLEQNGFSQLITTQSPEAPGLTTNDALSLVETYLLSELGVTGAQPSIGRGRGLNRRLPIRGIQPPLVSHNQPDSHIANQQNTNMRGTLATDAHKSSVTGKTVSHRLDLGSSIQLRNAEAPSDMSGIPPTSVLASEIAGANSHVRGMLQSGYVRRNVLAVVSPNKGIAGDQYFLAVAQDKSRIMIYKISNLLEELHDGTLIKENNGNMDKESVDLESKQGIIEQVCTTTLPFTVLSMCANPVNQQYMAVCGLKEVSVLIFTSMGSISSKTVVQPILEDSNQFIIYSMWLPGSLNYLVLILTQSVQIFDLSQTTSQPIYHFKSVESRFKDATFAFIPAKTTGSKISTEAKSDCYVLVMSESGCIHCKKLDKTCMASSGFYLAEMLDWNPELYNMNRDLKTGVLGKGGASIHYDHNLQLLFHSYNNGRTFCSVLDSGQDEIYVDKNYYVDIRNEAEFDCTLVNWFSIHDHPGLLMAICQQTNSPVYISVEPEKYCFQILEKSENSENDITDISVASLSKVTDAITFPWRTTLEDKIKVQRTLSMILFNDGRIKILMANIRSPNSDGRFWLQERFTNTFLNECLQGTPSSATPDMPTLELHGIDSNKSSSSKRHINKDEIFLDNSSCGKVPVDFFEHCEQTNEVIFGGDRFLELYSQEVLNLRMLSQDHSVSVACKNPVSLVITNKKPDSIIVGVRIGINVTDPTKIPKYFEIYNRKIPIPEFLNKNRLVDIGLYKSEILNNDKSLHLIIGPSKNSNDIIVIDYVKVFVRLKSSLLWLNEKQEFLRSKESSKTKIQNKSSSNMEGLNKCIGHIITNCKINLSTINPYLPKPELLSSGLQLLTAFFHFKNTLNLEGRPTFSSSEVVTSSVIQTFANDVLSSFYPSTIILNAITLLACVGSIKQIESDLNPSFKKCLVSNVGHKLFSSCSDLIKKLKHEEIDPVNVLLVEATITRLAHLINLHKYWMSIEEENWPQLSYLEIFDLMTTCIELITKYHAVCSSVQPDMGTDSEIVILANFINPVYCQKLDCLPSLIPFIIKGLLNFNFMNTENTSTSSDANHSATVSVQIKLTDLLINMLIDSNLTISHNTRRSLNYFMKLSDKKFIDNNSPEKKIDDVNQTSELKQLKKEPIENSDQNVQEFGQILQSIDTAAINTDDMQTLSILLPDNPEGPSNDNEPDEEEMDDREYFCRAADDEWMVAVSNSESNSLGGSTLANDATNFFQQIDTEAVPTMAEVMQEMIDNADDQRMLDYALRKSLEDQGGSSNDANIEGGAASNISQIFLDSRSLRTDPISSIYTEEEQQSLNNTGTPTIDNWGMNKTNKKNSKQAENLSTPDREYSESNSESDIATYAMLKNASITSKLSPNNSQKVFLVCIQKFGIQFIKRIIVKWSSLMISLQGTRVITLYKSVLDVIRYMDMRDEEARSVVQNLVELMLDLVLGIKKDDDQLTILEYDTNEKRIHCQSICVVLRTLLNFILSGSKIQTIVPPIKEDNNSTAAEGKPTPSSCFNQVFTQDSVAFITLKLAYEKKLISFCLLNLDQLLILWRNQSPDQKNSEKELDTSNKILKQNLTSNQGFDVSVTFDWLPMSDIDSTFDMHLLLTELILRLPYAVLKLCRNTLKEIKVGIERTSDDREIMMELVNSIQKESKWHSVLCEFIEVNISEHITKASRTLLNSVVGAKHYRTVRDIHLIGGSINKIKSLLNKQFSDHNVINRIKLPFDDTLKLLELVDSCINKVKERPSNWKVYCSKCPEILNFLMVNSVSLHETIGLKLLYLLQLALLESESSKLKKETASSNPPVGTSAAVTSVITSSKTADKNTQRKSAGSAPEVNKQEAKLCRALTSKMDNTVLAEFVKVYLCEHEDSGVRWLTEAVLSNLYNHGKAAFRLNLLNTLADCWSFSYISPQLADLIGHLLTKYPNWERIESFSHQLTNDIVQSSQELLSNSCTPFYNCLQRLVKLPGYYLDSEPCSVCLPPSSTNEMHVYRWDSEPTDNRRNQAKSATITGMGLHTASTAISNNDYLTPNVRSNPTVHVFNLRAPYSIQSITVKFTGTRRQRPQCGVTLYYSDISTVSTTQMLDQANLWQKVKTVTVSKDMAEMKLDFPVLLTAVYLIFEYDCFTGSVSNSDNVKCPRCHSASIQGNVCLNCRDNINQCFRCRAINYAGIDSFICANCSSCRYGRIDFSMFAKPCYDFIEELKSEESREVMINRITTWSETVEKNVQEMIILKQELEVFLDQIKMMDAAEMSSQKKVNNSAFITSGTNISGLGTTKLPVSGGKTYAEVTGASAMDDSGLPAKSYRRIRRAAGGENEPEKESTKPPNVNPITTAETVKEEKKDSHSKHIHDALNQLILKYSTDAKEQQLEIGCLWRQLWAAKKAVANYDTRLARAKNNLVNVNESLFESNKIRQNCYACLLSKLQQHIWLMKGLSFIPDIRHTVTNAANLKDMQSLFLGEILNAVSSSMRQEIVILVVQITRDKKEEVIKLNQLITSELLFALRTPYLSAPRESRIKVIISLLKSSIACPDSLWELRLRPAIAVLLEVSNNGPSSENCTKVVVAPCIALIQACMRFLVGKLKQPVLIKKPNLASENEPAIEHKSSLIFPSMPVLCINQWLQDDSSQLFETWLQCTREENQIPRDIALNSDQGNVGLIQKFASRWFNKVQKKKLSKVKFIKLVNVEDMFVSQAWLWQALLSSSNPSCRQATHLLVEMLGYQSFERHRIVLSVLVQCLPFMVSGIGANVDDLMKMCFPNRQPLRLTQKFQMTNNETSVQYVALLKRLCQEKHWRCYLVIKCRLIEIIDLAMSRVLKFLAQVEESCLDSWRNGQARPGLSNGGWVAINLLKSLAELLLHLQEIPAIAYKYRTTIVKCLLTSSLNMRRLIVFRSKITTDMESRFNKTVDDLSKDSEEIIRSFIKIAVSVLNQFPVTDLQSAGHIIEKINAYICPRDYEHPVFEVVLDIFKGQEDFLPHRMIGVSLSSQSFGHNPTVNDVINFLVRENGVTSDIRLDLICDKKVLMYDLLLEDIYEHVWLCSDANNKSRPMRLTVRISGLVEDNMPYVESLRKEVPLEHYQRSNELIEGGMHTIIERLAAVDELAHGFSVIASSVRLLNYFIKVPNNDVRLIEPGLDTVKVLLQCLLVCLKGGLDEKRMTEYEESTVVPLINLLCRILTLGRAGSITQQNHMINQVENMHAIPILLDYIHKNSRVELYQKHITKIPALLAFQFSHEMVLIIDYVVPHFQLLIPNAHIDDNQKQILLCCCNLMSSIPSDEYGTLFRHHMMEKGLLNICIDFLVAVAPEDALKEGIKLDLKRPDTIAFLEQQALQFLLVLGQACVGSNGFVEAGQILLAVPGLLGFLHKLETVKSVQAIGVLSEDWLNALKECSADMNKVISGLRSSTQKNLRAQALKVRQKQLNEMQMTVNDKGQVLTSSSLLKDLSSQVLEEPGHCCDICLDGYVNKPQESLGVYTFVKKVLVHDLMSGKMQALPNSVPCANQYYYTSVSNYVCVHFSCHNQAVKVVNENEWVVAQRHNQNAKCNSLMPILGPHPDNNFKANLNRYQTSIWNNTNVPEINYQLMVHDLKFLLLRFAHNRQFNEDTGGGARLSNIRLVPQIIQIAIANLISQADLINKEMQAMSKWLEQAGGGCKVFNQNLWQATNTPYRIVQFLLFHSRELWLQHRVQILKLLLQFAHMRHLNLADVSQIQPAQLEPLPYSIYHPFLVLFGIIHSFYNILLKNVTSSPGTGKAWMDAVSLYTRENDVALLDDSNKVIRFYEDNLLPCESLSEFWDVIELGYNIPFEEDYLSAVLTELKDVKQ